jgi:hypothetical protein
MCNRLTSMAAHQAGGSFCAKPFRFAPVPVMTPEQFDASAVLCPEWPAGWLKEVAGRITEMVRTPLPMCW